MKMTRHLAFRYYVLWEGKVIVVETLIARELKLWLPVRAYEPKNIQKKHHEQHEKFEINTLLKYDIYIYVYIWYIYIHTFLGEMEFVPPQPGKKKECYFSHQSINRHETSLHPSCHLSWLVGLKRCSLRSSFFTLKIEPRAAGKKVPWRVPLRCLEPRFFFLMLKLEILENSPWRFIYLKCWYFLAILWRFPLCTYGYRTAVMSNEFVGLLFLADPWKQPSSLHPQHT